MGDTESCVPRRSSEPRSVSVGYPGTRRDSSKFFWILWGGRRAQEASDGTRLQILGEFRLKRKVCSGSLHWLPKLSTGKKYTTFQLWVQFHLRTYSLGNSLSDNSEELLQKGKVRGQCIYDFGEGITCSQAQILVECCCWSWGGCCYL